MTPLRALMVEDNEDDMILIQEALRSGGYDVRVRRVETGEALRQALRDAPWDIVLSDYCLPAFDAQGTLRVLNETGLDIPVIVISGTVGEDVAVETLKLGAEDYLLKQNLTRLVPAVARALDVAASQRQHRKVEHMKTLILENSLDVICTLDAQGRFLEVSSASKTVLGYEPAELIGISFEKLVHPGELAAMQEEFQAVLQGRSTRDFACRFIHKSGGAAHLTWSIVLSRDDGVIVGVGRDITEREEKDEILRRVEDNVRRERALLRALIDSIPDLIFFKDQNFVFLGCNRAFENYLGISESQLIGKTDFDIMPDEEWARYYRVQDEKLFASGESQRTEEKIPGAGGRTGIFDTIKTPFHGPNGESLGLLGVSRDITERKQMEEDLRGERDFSDAALNGLPGIFYHFEEGGRFLRWNKNFEEVTGYGAGELAAMRAMDFFPEEDRERVAAAVAEAYEKGSSQVEAHFLLKDGRRVPYLFTGSRFGQNGRKGFIGIGTDMTEPKQMEENLRESLARFHAASRATGDVIWDWDLARNEIWWSENYHRLFGYSAEERGPTIVESWSNRIHPEDRDRVVASIHAVIDGAGETWVDEYRFLRRDGSYADVLDRGYVLRDSAGRGVRMVGAAQDITERKQMEEALREKTALFEAQVESSIAGIHVVDRDGRKVIQNQRLNEIWKIPPALAAHPHVGPQRQYAAQRTKDPGKFLARIAELEAHPEKIGRDEIELIDGTVVDLYSAPVLDKEGRYYGRTWIHNDITQRKQIEQALRRETALFEAQVEGSPDGILVVDRQGRKVIQNQRMMQLWKVPPEFAAFEEIAPQLDFVTAHRVKEPEKFRARIAWLYEHPGEIGRDEIELIDGTIMDRYSAPVLDKEGHYYGRLWLHRDITEDRRREKKLAEALILEKELTEQARAGERAKSEFLAVMSHEIRTPMNGILGFAELLRQAHGLSPENRDYARVITESGEALLRILDDILDFSRLEAGRMTVENAVFRPRALLDDIRTLLSRQAEESGVQLLVSCSPGVPERLEGDAGRLRQVLLNLAGNALKFTEQGSVRIDLAPLDDAYVFSVTDTGSGIPAELLDRIFQPFTQADSSISRRHGGTGLGLAISRRLTELLGGAITVKSTPGEGSEFRVVIPLGEAPLPQPGAADGSATPLDVVFAERHPLRMLIAEDDSVNLKLILALVRRLGYSPLAVRNGREAVEIFQRESPDFVLMDVQMPEMDGIEATQKIRALEKAADAKCPACVVALTANIFPADLQRCLDAGMDGYLNKPVKISALAEVFARASGARPTNPPPGP